MLWLIKFFSLIRLSFSGRVAEEDPWCFFCFFFWQASITKLGWFSVSICNSLLFPLYNRKHLGAFASWSTWLLMWFCKGAENVHLPKGRQSCWVLLRGVASESLWGQAVCREEHGLIWPPFSMFHLTSIGGFIRPALAMFRAESCNSWHTSSQSWTVSCLYSWELLYYGTRGK